VSGGKPEGELVITMLKAIVKVKGEHPRVLSRGDAFPDDALPGEKQRLAKLGALGRRKSSASSPEDASTATPDATPEGNGDASGGFDIEAADTEALAEHLAKGKGGKAFTIPEVLDMAKDDDPAVAASRARKLLDAEVHRSGNDARDGLTEGLVKLIEADPATPPA
jgi:hypothetical protein